MISDDKPQYFGQRQTEAMSFARKYHEWIVKEFKPYIGDTVAEVGAGTGYFSDLLLGQGVKRLVAFEPSENMYPALVERLHGIQNAHAVNDYFGVAQNGQKFDSVAYVNVLEHIEDDAGELSRAYNAIAPGGHILLFSPALQWLHGDLDRRVGHFRRYYKHDLVDKVRAAGFDVVKAKYFDLVGVIPWYVAFVLLRGSITTGNASFYDNFAVPIVRFVENIVSPPFGKNVLVVGRKGLDVASSSRPARETFA